MWEWIDAEFVNEEPFDDTVSVGLRRPWWEDMVAHLIEKVGWVSLT